MYTDTEYVIASRINKMLDFVAELKNHAGVDEKECSFKNHGIEFLHDNFCMISHSDLENVADRIEKDYTIYASDIAQEYGEYLPVEMLVLYAILRSKLWIPQERSFTLTDATVLHVTIHSLDIIVDRWAGC